MLDSLIKKYKMNNSLMKKKGQILIDSSFTPVEIFVLEYVLEANESVKYRLIKEEDFINDKKSLIIWGDYLNIVDKQEVVNIKNIKNIKLKYSDYILYGNSDNFEEYKRLLIKMFEMEILEYENRETILFERAC